ncbi:MAG: hypothetical protein PHO87_04980 [Acholeplasmataceae bacterium]|nr:hypothetical protein [Acholeplasmataceae bacterium]
MNKEMKYDCCLVICHGKSELIFSKNIKSNLRLKFETFAKKNGNVSIQITGLMNVLNSRDFKSLTNFRRKYTLYIKKGKIKNFIVFIIMDFDEQEYTPEIKNNYLNKSMFKGHFLYDYIVPIYNDLNFDDVMRSVGFSIDVKNKVKSYNKIFPGENGDYEQFKVIKERLSQTKKSNISILFEYLDQIYNNKKM